MLNKKILTPVLVTLFIGTAANAKTFSSACPDIVACIKSVSALTGEQYLIDVSELKLAQKAEILPDVELTAENANLFLTSLLHSAALSRVPNGNKTFLIQRENDAKGGPVPSYHASLTETPQIPDNWDISTLRYKATHPESVKQMENIVRTYQSMGARIYGVEHSGYLIVTDTAKSLKTALTLARENDVAISPALQKRWDEEARLRNLDRLKNSLDRGATESRPKSSSSSNSKTSP